MIRHISRRRWIATALGTGAAALGTDAFAIEPHFLLDVTHHARRADSRLPEIRVAQITDLHLRRIGRRERHLIAQLEAIEPDLLAFAGDSIDDPRNLALFDAFLGSLDARVPKVAILGNWEYWARVPMDALRSLYASHGVRLLVNETATFGLNGRTITVAGLDSSVGGRPNLDAALRGVSRADVLLQHCPGYRDVIDREVVGKIGFMLAGHTHGGQVAPLGWAPLRPPGSGRYVSGWYDDDSGPPMYVSRGIGTSVLPARLWCRPELAVFGV